MSDPTLSNKKLAQPNPGQKFFWPAPITTWVSSLNVTHRVAVAVAPWVDHSRIIYILSDPFFCLKKDFAKPISGQSGSVSFGFCLGVVPADGVGSVIVLSVDVEEEMWELPLQPNSWRVKTCFQIIIHWNLDYCKNLGKASIRQMTVCLM